VWAGHLNITDLPFTPYYYGPGIPLDPAQTAIIWIEFNYTNPDLAISQIQIRITTNMEYPPKTENHNFQKTF